MRAALRPVMAIAIASTAATASCLGEISAIMWPELAALPNTSSGREDAGGAADQAAAAELGHVQHQARWPLIRARLFHGNDQIFRVPQASKIRCGDDHQFIGICQRFAHPAGPDVRQVEHCSWHRRAQQVRNMGELMLWEIRHLL